MPRILLVEDEDTLRVMLKGVLINHGYEVQEACDGRQAVALYKQQQPHLVITDLVMPDVEGLELIMDMGRMYKDVKIIAISGGGTGKAGTYLKIAQALGAAFTLEKPFVAEDLLEMVRLALGESVPH